LGNKYTMDMTLGTGVKRKSGFQGVGKGIKVKSYD